MTPELGRGMHMRARWFALPAAVLVAMAVIGASTSAARPAAHKEQVTLKLLAGVMETAELEQKAKDDIKHFEQLNPDIKIDRESIDSEQLRTLIQTRLRSDAAPDIFMYDTGPGYGGVLAKAKLVKPLGSAYAKYNWKIYPWARARATYGGVTYGVPDQIEELGVFYNKDLFAKLGLKVPKTMDELQQISATLKSKGYIPLAFVDKDGWPASHQFSMLASNLLGRAGLQNIIFGNGKWNSPKLVKGIDRYFSQFNKAGYFPPSPAAISYEDGNSLFYAQKAAMLPTGTWLVSEINEKARNFKVGFFPFPSIDGSKVVQPAGIGAGLFVSARTKHWPEVQRYLQYIQSPAHAKYEIETFNTLPAFPVKTAGLKISPLYKQVIGGLVASGGQTSGYGENIDVLAPARFNDAMYAGFQDVLTGKKTAQQQADALEAAWQKAKKAGETLKKP